MACCVVLAAMNSDRVAHKFPLLDAALRGTAQYAHLISVDFFGDLMAELLRLLRAPGLPLPIRLQVLLTASDILRCMRCHEPLNHVTLILTGLGVM